ncbi:hypothetical protein, partial [Clavibacter michiganensis]|uniref:hypothetical protein n=1 Tax=Clavibacter michiganensis TaxID=28447 RepID=UPI00292DAE9B
MRVAGEAAGGIRVASDARKGSEGTYGSAGGGKPEWRAGTTTTPPGRSTAVPWLPPTFAMITAKYGRTMAP